MHSVIRVYTMDMCEPCMALKQWLRENNIGFEETYTKTLSEPERRYLRENILKVSRIDTPTVPAVYILVDHKEYWISNHGSSEVTEMTLEIKKILRDDFGRKDL